MRIRKGWPTTSPMPSNRLSQPNQIQEEKISIVAATAARAGLHPDEFLSTWPQTIPNQPPSLQRSNGKEHHPPPNPKLATTTPPTKTNILIDLDHDPIPTKIDQKLPNPSHVQAMHEKEEIELEAKAIYNGKDSIGSDSTHVSKRRPSKDVTSFYCTRKESSPRGEAAMGLLPSSPHPGVRWTEGERAFPFKKRRGSYDWGEGREESLVEKEKNMKSKTKKKTSTKYEQDEDYNNEEEPVAAENRVVKRRARNAGGPLKEGSRCSRINGRGWRCAHQTLVGYALCEHHLGKGRMKSIGSVGRGCGSSSTIRGLMKKDEDDGGGAPLLVMQKHEVLSVEDDEKEEEAQPVLPMVVVKKKRGRRLGWRRLDYSFLG